MDQILEKLLGSVPKARILRLFMRNPEERFRFEELVIRSQIRTRAVRTELKKFLRLGVIHMGIDKVESKNRGKKRARVKKVPAYYANKEFVAFRELRDLIARASVAPRKNLLKQINGIGKIKLAVLSGIFINNSEKSRIDLLVVGDNINRRKLSTFLANTESELGKAIQHTVMDMDEFKYRTDMYDRFLRDILEYPHEKLINRLNL